MGRSPRGTVVLRRRSPPPRQGWRLWLSLRCCRAAVASYPSRGLLSVRSAGMLTSIVDEQLPNDGHHTRPVCDTLARRFNVSRITVFKRNPMNNPQKRLALAPCARRCIGRRAQGRDARRGKKAAGAGGGEGATHESSRSVMSGRRLCQNSNMVLYTVTATRDMMSVELFSSGRLRYPGSHGA